MITDREKEALEFAPEWAEIVVSHLNKDMYAKHGKDDSYFVGYDGSVLATGWDLSFDLVDLRKKIESEKETKMIKEKPVYTQEMFDNDRQPLVGMKAMVSVKGSSPIECTVKYLSDLVVIEDTCPSEYAFHISTCVFSPIDTRTPQQKQLEDIYDISVKDGYHVTKDYLEYLQERGHFKDLTCSEEI